MSVRPTAVSAYPTLNSVMKKCREEKQKKNARKEDVTSPAVVMAARGLRVVLLALALSTVAIRHRALIDPFSALSAVRHRGRTTVYTEATNPFPFFFWTVLYLFCGNLLIMVGESSTR